MTGLPAPAGIVTVARSRGAMAGEMLVLVGLASKMETVLFAGLVTYKRFSVWSRSMKLAPAPAELVVLMTSVSVNALITEMRPVPLLRTKTLILSSSATAQTGLLKPVMGGFTLLSTVLMLLTVPSPFTL